MLLEILLEHWWAGPLVALALGVSRWMLAREFARVRTVALDRHFVFEPPPGRPSPYSMYLEGRKPLGWFGGFLLMYPALCLVILWLATLSAGAQGRNLYAFALGALLLQRVPDWIAALTGLRFARYVARTHGFAGQVRRPWSAIEWDYRARHLHYAALYAGAMLIWSPSWFVGGGLAACLANALHSRLREGRTGRRSSASCASPDETTTGPNQ